MAGLADTIAELLARSRSATPAERSAGLREVVGFGANPGALRMWLYRPEALPSGAPLVVVLHGCGQTAGGYASGAGWLALAARHGFAVLCVEQVRGNNANLCFNWFEDEDVRRGGGEAASIAQMVGHAVAAAQLDATRVFVTGLSAGGAMTAVMLAAYPELFAAGAVVAGLPYGAASGVNEALGAMRRMPARSGTAWGDKVRAAAPPPVRWPSVSVWYGDADGTVTPQAARALVLQWCDVHGVDRAASRSTAGRRTRVVWRRPDGSPAVELNRVAGLGHGVPISAEGEDGCGSPAPWILEAGLSSSAEIARSWGIVTGERSAKAAEEEPRKNSDGAPHKASSRSPSFDVQETIAQALRSAGLTRSPGA